MSKLSPGTLIVGIFAVLFGLVGAYAAKQHFANKVEIEQPVAKRPLTVPLASVNIVPGRKITKGDIMIAPLTQEQIKQRNMPPQFMTHPAQVIGRIVREPVAKGKAFTPTDLYPEGTGPSVAERLKPGYRAMTIPIENAAAVAGMAAPGSVVDVLFRTLPNDDEGLPETTVSLLERVEVLALGQDMFPGSLAAQDERSRAAAANSVTLAVTPKQASALKVVEGRGELSLVVRRPEDDAVATAVVPQTMESLLGLGKAEKPFTTQVYRRGRLETVLFENGRKRVIEVSADDLPVGRVTAKQSPAKAEHMVAIEK